MPYITKSKEAYKRMPHVRPELNPLRAVRGLYISGKWRPAHYADICVQVRKIGSRKAKVVDYTQAYKTIPYEPILNIITFNASNLAKVIQYTTTYKTFQEPILNLITFKSTGVKRLDYSRNYQTMPYEPILNLITFKSTNKLWVQTTIQKHAKYGTMPEHTITLRDFTTTKAVVGNYTP